MAAAPEVVIESSADSLAAAVAARVVSTLVGAQRDRGRASLVLTGGSILESVFGALAASPERDSVDWRQVDVFWGDERFVDSGSPDRNDGPAATLLLDHLDLDRDRVHRMPSSDGPDGGDLDAAAARYARTLAEAAGRTTPADNVPVGNVPAGDVTAGNVPAGDVPAFDVCLIGLGPDGHCCSLFPGQPGVYEEKLAVIGVRDSPKPPPLRTSLTFRALDAAEQIWFVAAGDGKADAVAKALGGADRVDIPSAGPRGKQRTLWLLDEAAAAQLPPSAQ